VIVADASAVIQASLSEADLESLGRYDLVAPPLLWSEATSAIHELRWRRQISADLASVALARFSQFPIRSRRPATLYREAWRIADRLGWAKTYDAEYVVLARRLECALLATDARLERGAGRIVRILVPTSFA
jgi:predicted nucleic acid-binding protein